MARWQVTIAHPTNAIPAVVLDCFSDGGEGYSRIDPQVLRVGDRTPAGTLTFSGGVGAAKYTWSFTVDLSESDARRLGALMNLQDATYDSGADGYLTLTDEVRYLDPESSPHSRTLLASLSAGYNSMVYGFGVFQVKLSRPSDDGRKLIGIQDGEMWERVTFTAVEV